MCIFGYRCARAFIFFGGGGVVVMHPSPSAMKTSGEKLLEHICILVIRLKKWTQALIHLSMMFLRTIND
jgi:hypothetical protein